MTGSFHCHVNEMNSILGLPKGSAGELMRAHNSSTNMVKNSSDQPNLWEVMVGYLRLMPQVLHTTHISYPYLKATHRSYMWPNVAHKSNSWHVEFTLAHMSES